MERSGHLTKKQIAEYKEAFNLIDKDGSGRISRNELSSLFLALRQKVTSAELKDLMTGVDTDGDGTLDFPEFLTMMSSTLESTKQEQELQKAFREFDKDGNGYISRDELIQVMHSQGDELTDEEIDGMIKTADQDKDGQVDYREFVAMMKQQ
jgi:calmodulin